MEHLNNLRFANDIVIVSADLGQIRAYDEKDQLHFPRFLLTASYNRTAAQN